MKAENKKKILIVDDEEDICEILKFNLESEGYMVEAVLSAEDALKKPLQGYHLFILDVMMHGLSGYKLADELKKVRKLDTPIIFLTAKNTENDKLTGFSLGADDYITKPFSVREIAARVKAVLKRVKENAKVPDENIKMAGIELDIQKKRIIIDGDKTDLTPHEFLILHLLLKNYGLIFSRNEILSYAWQDQYNVVDRTVDVHITRLRKKLGEYGKYLISRSGHGYCFDME